MNGDEWGFFTAIRSHLLVRDVDSSLLCIIIPLPQLLLSTSFFFLSLTHMLQVPSPSPSFSLALFSTLHLSFPFRLPVTHLYSASFLPRVSSLFSLIFRSLAFVLLIFFFSLFLNICYFSLFCTFSLNLIFHFFSVLFVTFVIFSFVSVKTCFLL